MSEIKSEKSSDVFLKEVLEIKSIEGAFLVGRDGFVVEALMNNENAKIDADVVGASVAGAVSRSLELEAVFNTNQFMEMLVQYEKKVLACYPVGDLFIAVLSSDASSMASMRFKLKKIIPDSIEFA
ncbi:MAG: roadblock/LC7 domain-containing protein [bacterium]|nr:roadblock/LC7 domain-containing protein [bacterium]